MKNQKNIFIVTCLAMIFFCVLCHAEESWQVLDDPCFQNGFLLTGTDLAETFGREDVTPRWRIAQWYSRGKLDRTEMNGQAVRLFDDAKSVMIDLETGEVNLAVSASKEYETPRSSAASPWVHLLLEQTEFAEAIRMAEAEEIWVEVEFELTAFCDHEPQHADSHAAQFSWFFYVKNAETHDFLWFGLSLFDSRHDFTRRYAAQDFAVPDGKFIVLIGSDETLTEKVTVGRRLKIRRDILPDLREALATAHENGFLSGTAFSDLTLDGTNIGWEVPGVLDVGMTIRGMKVYVKR